MNLKNIRYPAEWEKQKATWLAFPHNKKNWSGEKGKNIRKFYVNLIRIISEFQKVNVLIPNNKYLTEEEKSALSDRPFCTSFYEIKTDDIWIRDYGPFFLKKENKTIMAKSIFNAWGKKFPPWKEDSLIPEKISKAFKYPLKINIPYVFEGGAIEVNGDRLGITTLDCLVGKNRNNPKDLSKIIKTICSAFGLKSLLVLPKGLFGDHTDGHIDNVARFVKKNHVVMAFEKNARGKNAINLAKCKYLIETFLKAHYGNKAIVDTLPLPPQRTINNGEILPASYMNFIYVNGALIYPKYKSQYDIEVQKYFEKIYPKRKIIGIDCRCVIEEGGSLHCLSKHETLI